jgi:dolichol-phosphate mannosyltransferase
VFFIDSDGQYVAADFWRLYDKIGDYDMIVGRKTNRADPSYRIILSKVFHEIIRMVFELPLHDPDCGYRIIRKNFISIILEEVRYLEYSFWSEFTIRAFKKGFKIVEVPIQHRRRSSGGTKLYTPDKLLEIMILQFIGLLKLWKELRT